MPWVAYPVTTQACPEITASCSLDVVFAPPPMSEPTVSFRCGVVEQTSELQRLNKVVKDTNMKSAAAWLDFLRYKRQLLCASGQGASLTKLATEWKKLALLHTTALRSLSGTPMDADHAAVKAGEQEALRYAVAGGCGRRACVWRTVFGGVCHPPVQVACPSLPNQHTPPRLPRSHRCQRMSNTRVGFMELGRTRGPRTQT